MDFFKLYTPPKGRVAHRTIDLFYCGCPLYKRAIFATDRYEFELPLNLREKMVTGNLYADFRFSGRTGDGIGPLPDALVLVDRYD